MTATTPGGDPSGAPLAGAALSTQSTLSSDEVESSPPEGPVRLELEYADALFIADNLSMFADIDEGEYTDYDRLRELSRLIYELLGARD